MEINRMFSIALLLITQYKRRFGILVIKVLLKITIWGKYVR